MKKRIISEYLKTVVFAVGLTFVLFFAVCIFLIFSKRETDGSKPQYLVRTIGMYITIENNEITVPKEQLKKLEKYDLWMQVIDDSGCVVYQFADCCDIPSEYNMLTLADAVMYSDSVNGYTVFIGSIDGYEGYYVLIGCDSEKISKYTYTYSGNTKLMLIMFFILFIITAVISISVAALGFSKTISLPMVRALENINRVKTGETLINVQDKEKGIFPEVFDSVEVLEKELKKGDKQRAEWIVNISHDIKTPLSTIKGYAEMLGNAEYSFEKTEIMDYANRIVGAEETIYGLVEDLKMSESLIEGKVTLTYTKVDLDVFLSKCIDESRMYVGNEADILLESSGSLYVNLDEKLMKRCMVNIICNAFIHNDPNISVKLSHKEIDDAVEICVSDNGKGMDDAELEAVFKRYYRGKDSSKVSGTGLGLAISKEVVVAHGGKIWAERNGDGGTSFKIILKKEN